MSALSNNVDAMRPSGFSFCVLIILDTIIFVAGWVLRGVLGSWRSVNRHLFSRHYIFTMSLLSTCDLISHGVNAFIVHATFVSHGLLAGDVAFSAVSSYGTFTFTFNVFWGS